MGLSFCGSQLNWGIQKIAVSVPYNVIPEASGMSFRSPPRHFLGVKDEPIFPVIAR